MDMDQRTRMLGGRPGRIILLGDGTEVLTDHTHGDEDGDVDMDERGEASEDEDKDLAEQVKKGQSESSSTTTNGAREETPGPQANKEDKTEGSSAASASAGSRPGDSLDINQAEKSLQ